MQRKILIRGTLILTFTGIATRLIGFFYRIFLSRSFGETAVGLYQLIFPVYALAISFTSAGIQTAVSRSVAREHTLHRDKKCTCLLYTGIGLSFLLSMITMYLLQHYNSAIAIHFLHEPRCMFSITAMSYAIPFASIHSCICGYYLGLKQTRIPAFSQLIEQTSRVVFVCLLFTVFTRNGSHANVALAVAGLAAGEFFSMSYSLYILRSKQGITLAHSQATPSMFLSSLKELTALSVPLTANRILLNILQSIEAVSIPVQLRVFGMDTNNALRMYGVLTGMALPLILFPTAVSNSIASMTLPAIAELQASRNHTAIKIFVSRLCLGSLLLGAMCSVVFLFGGSLAGIWLFHSSLAGKFITTLAWICPFLYTNSILTSIINGLGKPFISFLYNSLHLIIRILSIYIYIPQKGIYGYLIGLLFSQVLLFFLSLQFLYRYFQKGETL